MNNQPVGTPIGDALTNAIDGNEPVAVGAAIAVLYNALQGYALYKGWVSGEDVAAITPIVLALITLGAIVVRQKVWSKQSAARLLKTDPNQPLTENQHKLLREAK